MPEQLQESMSDDEEEATQNANKPPGCHVMPCVSWLLPASLVTASEGCVAGLPREARASMCAY